MIGVNLQKLQVIGERYRLLEKIGEGGMAVIYLALDEKLGRKVAIKILHEHLCENQDIRNRFQLEAQAISSLDHPNIVKIYDFSGNYSRQLWIVTEVIRGQNLSEYCDGFAQKRLHPALASLMIRELCKALQAAHQSGIVHRDIKPENIMFTLFGDIKLMDFGIAKDIHNISSTQTGTFMGSPSYMSPEQVRGKDIDHRTDLYSVGVVFFELITGRIPFVGNTMHEVVIKIMEGKYTPPHMLVPNIPIEISVIIQKCLERDLEKRFASSDLLAQEIDKILVKFFNIEDSQIELQRFMKDRYAFFKKLNSFSTSTSQDLAKILDPVTVQIQHHNQAAIQESAQITRITPPPPLQKFRENSLASLRSPLVASSSHNPHPSPAPRRDRLIPSSRIPKSLGKQKVRKAKPNPKQAPSAFIKEARYAPRARSYVSQNIPFEISSFFNSPKIASLFSWFVLLGVLTLGALQVKKIFTQFENITPQTPAKKMGSTPNVIESHTNTKQNQENESIDVSPTGVKTLDPSKRKDISSAKNGDSNNLSKPDNKIETHKNKTVGSNIANPVLIEIPNNPAASHAKSKNPNLPPFNQDKNFLAKARLRISTLPAAEIFKSGQRIGTTNDLGSSSKWLELTAGRHELVLKRQGFEDYWVQINLNPNESRNLQNLKLSPLRTSTLRVVSQEIPFLLKIETQDKKIILEKSILNKEHKEELVPDLYTVEISSKNFVLKRRIQILPNRQTIVIEFNPRKTGSNPLLNSPKEDKP